MKKLLLAFIATTSLMSAAEDKPAPLFRDFVGLCGHTVNFKPELYAPVCNWVRDYHPVEWDLQKDTSVLPEWPFAKNRVSWDTVYGSWRAKDLRISACLMFDGMKDVWKDPVKDAEAYAAAFARQFGPGGKWPFVDCVEIGNEPGLYSDEEYLRIFDAMSKGIRAANPKLKIATCNVEAEKSDRYWKCAPMFKDRAEAYDVLQIHRYAIAEGWPKWRRTYPEDASVPYLSSIQALLDWRAANAPQKEVWVTEFGWDTSTKKPDPKSDMAQWMSSTDDEQARYLVRSFFLFAGMGVEKAFVYFFDDKDEPKFHAASGLTRNYQPKPAYHAVAWMLSSLKDHRFSRVIQSSLDEGYVYEFTPEQPAGPVIWAAWHATKDGVKMQLPAGGRAFVKAEAMPVKEGAAPAVAESDIAVIGQHPTLIWWK
ncbi:MAG: hypothetical protein KDK97_21735 [Verrucomicrobiales bacterium]|nr:hypothetical protein [Verrucomicrobiales bacterium]MCP5559538.1 hypothetical protein [Verrucomicrobiaceae bacterium]